MKKILRLICVMALVIGLLPLTASVKAEAASEPIVTSKTENGTEIEMGTSYNLEFVVLREFSKEKLHVDIYYGAATSTNSKVSSSTSEYGSNTSSVLTQSVNWDTSDCAPGVYTIVYYMEYFTLGSWHTGSAKSFTVKVISDKYGSFDDSETGYTMSEAYSASLNTQYMKAWTSANDDASCLHKITIPESGKVSLNMTKPRTSNGKASKVDVIVYTEEGTIAAGATLGRNEDILDTYNYSVYLAKGTYYIDLKLGSSIFSGSVKSTYSFSFEKNDTAEIEPNSTIAAATKLNDGVMYDAFFGSDGNYDIDEDDYFKFDVTAGDTVTVKLSNYSVLKSTTAIMNLQPPTGSSVSFFHNATSDGNDIGQYTFIAEVSGTYSIRLYNYSKESIPYQIGVVSIKPAPEPTAEEKAAAAAKDTLNNKVADAKNIPQGNYTDESYQSLQTAIAEAEALAKDSTATAAQLQAAADKVSAAKAALTEKGADNGEVPAPTEPTVKTGDTIKYKSNTYKVLSVENKTVTFTKAKNTKTIVIPASIKINDESYKVTTINANAFKAAKVRSVTIGKNVRKIKSKAFYGSKATTVTLKTKLLKKAGVKGSLKSSKVKTIKVKITSNASTTNKNYVTKYKKIFTKANAGKKVTVK